MNISPYLDGLDIGHPARILDDVDMGVNVGLPPAVNLAFEN